MSLASWIRARRAAYRDRTMGLELWLQLGDHVWIDDDPANPHGTGWASVIMVSEDRRFARLAPYAGSIAWFPSRILRPHRRPLAISQLRHGEGIRPGDPVIVSPSTVRGPDVFGTWHGWGTGGFAGITVRGRANTQLFSVFLHTVYLATKEPTT